MAVRRKMGFSVRELLLEDELNEVKLLGGEKGLDKEIKGVTIIEAPDIVKFIDGGEVLLTGLYAFLHRMLPGKGWIRFWTCLPN